MAKVDSATLRNWNNGETMNESDYEQEREILRTAINDNYDRLIKTYNVLNTDGTVKATQNLDTAINFLKFKETAQIVLTLDTTGSILTIGVVDGSITTSKLADVGVTTAKLADGNVTTVKVADLAITTGKIADGAVTLQKIDTASLDTRYYTESEVDVFLGNKADKSTTYTKTESDNLLAYKTDKTGDHSGTWQGLTPGEASEAINGARLDVLEPKVEGVKEVNRQQDRLLAYHEAWMEIDGRATPNSGKIIDLIDGNSKHVDLTKASSDNSLTTGTTSITVTMNTGVIGDFKVGQEVTVFDDVSSENVIISAVDTTNNILTVSALVNSYKAKATIARTTADYDTTNKKISVGGWDNRTTNTITDKTVVASAYDTSGNGGRKLVRLDNGWFVSAMLDTSVDYDAVRLFVSKDNGASWSQLCYLQNSVHDMKYVSLSSKGNIVYVLGGLGTISVNEFYVVSFIIDATTVTNTNVYDSRTVIEGQTALNSVSLATDGTSLFATWASKNATYPNSFNIRYAKGTINADGSATWGTVVQVTKYNTTGADWKNPSITLVNGVPVVIPDYVDTTQTPDFFGIYILKGDTTLDASASLDSGWTLKRIYGGADGYAQSNPSAIVDKDGVIHVAWHGTDSTDTTNQNLRYSKSTDGGATWSAMEKLTSGNTSAKSYASITTNKNGKIFILFIEGTSGGSPSYYNVQMITNDGTGWSAIVDVNTSSTASKLYPSALYDNTFTLDFSEPLFIYQDNENTKVGFYGTWTTGNKVELLESVIRHNVTPNPTTAEVVSWITREIGDLTLDGFVSIVDTASNESYAAMTKSTTTVDATTEEDQFVGSVTTAEERVTTKLVLKRTSTANDKAITKVLGGIS